MKSARVLQVTDLHVGEDASLRFEGRDPRRHLAALDRVLAATAPPDLLLLTGDLVHDAPAAYPELLRRFAELGAPVMALPGNHDDPAALRVACAETGVQPCGHRDVGAWRVVGVDSHLPGAARGLVGRRALAQVDAALAEAPQRPTLVAVHHQPVPVGSAWLDAIGLDDPAPFLETLEGHRQVRVVVFGHVHQVFERERGRLTFLGAPAVSVQFRPGTRWLTIDPSPPGYRELTLHPNGRFATRVVRFRVDDA